VSTLSLSLAACGSSSDDTGDDDDDDVGGECYENPAACVAEEGQHYQYVTSEVTMPTSQSQASQLGIDLDDDPMNRPDNQLGSILSAVASMSDADLQAEVDQQVADGGIIILFDLKATDLASATDAGAWVMLGDAPTPSACADEQDMVCGRHLDGTGMFEVSADSPMDAVLHGDIVGGKLTGGPGEVSMKIGIAGSQPIRINMIGSRVEVSVSETGLMSGKLGGAVTEEELNNNVLPAVAEALQEQVDEDCTGTAPMCCEKGSGGEDLLGLFDADDDCAITLDELKTNDLISALLSPDVDLLDADGTFSPNSDGMNDSLSLGVGFAAVRASFPGPQ
jgi:hypothetical protein